MWLIVAIVVSVIAAMVQMEVGIVVAIGAALWWCVCDATPTQTADRSMNNRAARKATNHTSHQTPPRRKKTHIDTASVGDWKRNTLQSKQGILPFAADEEHFLDTALTQQKMSRGVIADHKFHTHALPRFVAARSRDLPNTDPSIRMLNATGPRKRGLGEI